MRPLNDHEFENFKQYVKCGWLDCAHGMGLAGQGICSHSGGKWNRKKCPEYISEADFLAQWKARADAQQAEEFDDLPF